MKLSIAHGNIITHAWSLFERISGQLQIKPGTARPNRRLLEFATQCFYGCLIWKVALHQANKLSCTFKPSLLSNAGWLFSAFAPI